MLFNSGRRSARRSTQVLGALRGRKANWDDVYRVNYRATAFTHASWLRHARNLMAAARELEPDIRRMWESYRAHTKNIFNVFKPSRFVNPYFMLSAFAIENLLKARLVQLHANAFRARFDRLQKFPHALKSHDLIRLAKASGERIYKAEEDLMRRLSINAIWAGRYPVPVEVRSMASIARYDDGQVHPVSWYGEHDFGRINALYNRFERLVEPDRDAFGA